MIRTLVAGDAGIFQELRLLALRESPDSFGSSPESEAGKSLAQMAERISPREDGSVVFGYFYGATLVGTIGFMRDDGPKERHKASIRGMYVHPGHRRKGIAIDLMRALIEHARRTPGVRQIKLTVTSSNDAARRLYTRFGFTAYGVETDSLTSSSGFLDETLMVLRLT